MTASVRLGLSAPSAVAARYAVDLTAGDDNAIAGSHEGTVGVAWEHTGKVSGELKPDAAP